MKYFSNEGFKRLSILWHISIMYITSWHVWSILKIFKKYFCLMHFNIFLYSRFLILLMVSIRKYANLNKSIFHLISLVNIKVSMKLWIFVYPVHICAFKNDTDTCQGDSGGPLTFFDNTTHRNILLGVTSYGTECADNK